MLSRQIGLSQCVAISGLDWSELVLGVEPSSRHDRLLRAFLESGRNDCAEISRDLVGKIRLALRFEETRVAADLLIVLRRILALCARPATVRIQASKRRGLARMRACVATR